MRRGYVPTFLIVSVMAIAMMAVGVAAKANPPSDGAWPSYSVRLRAMLLASSDRGLDLYRQLKEKGYLAYAYEVQVDGEWWFQVGVDAFQDREAAYAFSRSFAAAEGFEHVISRSPVRVVPAADGNDFVVTPNALWIRNGSGQREVFEFGSEAPLWHGLADVILARLSPDRTSLAFLYDRRVYTVSIDSERAVPLNDGETPVVVAGGDYPWQLGWSPSGNVVAFLDQAFWEYPVGLWAADSDGGDLRCLSCDEAGRDAVRWFVWHPTEERVLFVRGYGFGTVAIGGDLLSVGMDGTVRSVAAVARGEREQIKGPLRIEDGYLHFERLRWTDDNYTQFEVTDDRVPIDAL